MFNILYLLGLLGLNIQLLPFYSVGASILFRSDPLVSVAQGQLKGSHENLPDGTPYYSFKGIPYAQIPARFLAPQPPKPWNGVLSAKKNGAKCTQYITLIGKITVGSEDCLFLNVYTKSLDKKSKLPVMVFIPGGGFTTGSGDDTAYGPEFLIQHDVILVTINYRLEALGFLCLDTPEVPGNAGMRDQVAALRWVKENIEQFGGNPDDVTLFGESAGSASVAFHIHSPMSKGLFHKAILQSGVSFNEWAHTDGGKERALRVASHLGKQTTDTTEALKFLQSVPVDKLTNITYWSMTEDEIYRGLPIYFTPVVEKKFDNVEPFLIEQPTDSLLSGNINKVPIMIGYNSDEAILFLEYALNHITNKDPKYIVPREIGGRISAEKTTQFGKRITSLYTNDKELEESNINEINNMLTDAYFVSSIHRFAYFHSSLSTTYFYRFSLDTELNLAKKISKYGDITKGASHADDLFYLFSNLINNFLILTKPKLIENIFKMTKLWTNFAKTGNPTPDNGLGLNWLPYTPSNRTYLRISDQFTVGRNADKPRMDFWNELYCDAGLPCIPESDW